MLNPVFADALKTFVDATQANITSEELHQFPKLVEVRGRSSLSTDAGRKYVKVVKTSFGQASVFCFVRIEDGAILKAAGWNAPAKHARGSIYVNAGQDAVTTYGANYLR